MKDYNFDTRAHSIPDIITHKYKWTNRIQNKPLFTVESIVLKTLLPDEKPVFHNGLIECFLVLAAY